MNCFIIIKQLHINGRSKTFLIQSAKNKLDTLPIRAYLDDTVIPLVLQALSSLAQEKTKPENPIEYVADYLLKNNPEEKAAEQRD